MILPPFHRIRRRFESPRLDDVPQAIRAELEACGVGFQAGSRVAVAVGSRGIANLSWIVGETLRWLEEQGVRPFIVPAMGSHGGATPEGQTAVLREYGVSEEKLGVPVVSSLDVVELPGDDVPIPVFFDKAAFESSGTIVINRVKPHTSFHGPHESGLIKMIAVGLGKHRGALAIHRLGVRGLREVMPRVALQCLRHANIRLGIGVVENSKDETMLVRAAPASSLFEVDQELLGAARAAMPSLPASRLDLLIVDEMGKDISGLGMDTNVIGRLKIPGEPEPASPQIRLIIVRALTGKTCGNAAGIGLADIVTRKLYHAIDFPSTYENVLTSTFLERAKIPLIANDDSQALEFAERAAGMPPLAEAHIIRIKNTLRLEEAWISESLYQEVGGLSDVAYLGRVERVFDAAGQLGEL
ncbi:MAG: DUF2088 domain-containing protein [Acidobacteria bacterium]|nr:MAG: DUF2088 domain-containing protein [Acidobacteriota bacterium]